MSSVLPSGFIVALLVVLTCRYIIYPGFISPFSKVPKAHFSVTFTSAWIRWKRPKGTNAIQTLLALHEKHGPVVRLSPGELSVASLDGLRQVYTGAFEKAKMYAEFENYGESNLVSMLPNKPHSTQKRMISNVYAKSSIMNSVDIATFTRVLLFNGLFPTLNSATQQDEGFDAYSFTQAVASDFVTSFLFGVGNCSNFIHDIDARKKFMANFYAKRDGVDVKRATKELEAYVLALCKAAESLSETESVSRPVLYAQLSSQLEKSSVPQRQRELIVASEMFDHIAATVDSSTITITYLEWELSRNLEIQASLRKELRSLSCPLMYNGPQRGAEATLPDPKELDTLPLLNAILKEVLRVYTPSPALLHRVTPPSGAVIEGYAIPGGITIGTSAKVMHMNEKVFPNAASFKPGRWLSDGNPECEDRIKEMNRWFWAFGSGGRMCIGSHFAIHMLKTIVAAIYSNYETTIVNDGGMASMEQEDTFMAGPVGRKLELKFRTVSDRS